MNVRSNTRLIISTSPIDHDRIIGSIENLIDPSVFYITKKLKYKYNIYIVIY
jgi:hypothetical protein